LARSLDTHHAYLADFSLKESKKYPENQEAGGHGKRIEEISPLKEIDRLLDKKFIKSGQAISGVRFFKNLWISGKTWDNTART
jgi:hypothetical protein